MIRNIIFDWSGTLVDDLPAVWAASNHVFERAGVEPFTLERFRSEFQLPFAPFYARYVAHVPIADLERWFHERFAQVQDSVVALPFAREFLEFGRAAGWRMFVLSAVHPRLFAAQAAATGFAEFVEKPYVGVADKREVIARLLAENGLNPAETLFIGDMEHDVETARHGGVPSAAVLTGYNSAEQLRAAGPDLIVEHLDELRRVLERHGHRLPGRGEAVARRRPVATVGGLIFDPRGRVLMLRTHKWSNLWGIPGGKIEWGEPSEDALRRELREETGLEVTDVRFVLVQDAIHPPEFHRDAHFLLLNYTCRAPDGAPVILNDEAEEYRWVTPEEARALPLNTPTRVLLDAVCPAGGA